jgi:uncharacterized coiled-coil DUF342 family protein
MKTLNGIKLIKRQDKQEKKVEPLERAVTINSLTKKSERKLVNKITSWVQEKRDRQHIEQIKNIRCFFGDSPTKLDTVQS